jgi:hypothetical protein
MAVRTLPAMLVLAAALADARRAHQLAFYLLLLAVPAGGAAALGWFGVLVDSVGGTDEESRAKQHAAASAVALALIVVACAIRSPARLEAGVPAAGVSAVLACLCVYGVQALLALSRLKVERLVAAPRRSS